MFRRVAYDFMLDSHFNMLYFDEGKEVETP